MRADRLGSYSTLATLAANAVLVALEVDLAILPLVAAAPRHQRSVGLLLRPAD
jgi:hypothetical protein